MSTAEMLRAIRTELQQQRVDMNKRFQDRHSMFLLELEKQFPGCNDDQAIIAQLQPQYVNAQLANEKFNPAATGQPGPARDSSRQTVDSSGMVDKVPSRGRNEASSRKSSKGLKIKKAARKDEGTKGRLRRLVNNPRFDTVINSVIAVTAICLVLEMQYKGVKEGYDIGYVTSGKLEDYWPGAEIVWIGTSWVCGSIFTAECILKVVALGPLDFAKDKWNWLDFCIVSFWIMEFPFGLNFPFNPMMLRYIRLARLFRLVRLVHQVFSVEPLILMVEAIKGARSIFLWSTLLLLTIMVTGGIFMQQVLTIYIEDDSHPIAKRLRMYAYFGTFTRALQSMAELTLGNYIVILRIIQEDVGEALGVVLLLYKLCVGFAIMSIIRGIFMQEVFQVARSNDQVMVMNKEKMIRIHTDKMTRLFEDADVSKDGYVNYTEFTDILQDDAVKLWLAAQEVSVNEPDWLFNHIAGSDGMISAQELVVGIGKLKGMATAMDLSRLEERQDRILEHLLNILEGQDGVFSIHGITCSTASV